MLELLSALLNEYMGGMIEIVFNHEGTVAKIIERGAEWFKTMGTPRSYGPKLYCVSGHVNKQVCVELPLGITCRALIDEHAGGVWKGRKAKG